MKSFFVKTVHLGPGKTTPQNSRFSRIDTDKNIVEKIDDQKKQQKCE
jgi:hypothetical protein